MFYDYVVILIRKIINPLKKIVVIWHFINFSEIFIASKIDPILEKHNMIARYCAFYPYVEVTLSINYNNDKKEKIILEIDKEVNHLKPFKNSVIASKKLFLICNKKCVRLSVERDETKRFIRNKYYRHSLGTQDTQYIVQIFIQGMVNYWKFNQKKSDVADLTYIILDLNAGSSEEFKSQLEFRIKRNVNNLDLSYECVSIKIL